MKFNVEITETLQRTVTIDALDENEAIIMIKELYKNCHIILDADDYIDTIINIR